MILKRKIYSKLLDWKNGCGGTKAIMVEGARRIGKSTIVEEFAKKEYESYILIDFAKKDKIVEEYFNQYLNHLDDLFMLLSTYYGVNLETSCQYTFSIFSKNYSAKSVLAASLRSIRLIFSCMVSPLSSLK